MKHERVKKVLASAGVCALLASCASEQAAVDVRETQAQLLAPARTLDGDSPGQTAVVLRWLKVADATRAKGSRRRAIADWDDAESAGGG
jgi:hypothetical protein